MDNKLKSRSPSESTTADRTANRMFRIFANPRYALYFGGQLISQVGTWMQMVALSWFTYSLTNSPFLLAVVGASSQLPALVVMPFAGVFADRLNRHKVVIVTQSLAMVQAGLLAALALSHQVQVWHLIALGVFAGVINAFDMPTRSAFVFELVDNKEDLPNAIAMNSSLMNLTRLIGPALAGFVVASVGAGMCFLLNAVSYVAVIVALLFIKGDFSPKIDKPGRIIDELKSGFAYVSATGPVRALILLLGIFGMGGMAYSLLLPVYVKQIGGDANTLGYLMSASAAGALAGTLFLASRKSVVGLGRWIVRSSFAFAIALMAFAFAGNVWIAALLLAFIGAGMMIQMAASNTILQSIVDEDKRGRVMSLFTMAFMGAAPLGSLIAGAFTSKVGLQWTLFGCGVYCLVVAVVFAKHAPHLKAETRPLYVRKGIMEAEEETELLIGEGAV